MFALTNNIVKLSTKNFAYENKTSFSHLEEKRRDREHSINNVIFLFLLI